MEPVMVHPPEEIAPHPSVSQSQVVVSSLVTDAGGARFIKINVEYRGLFWGITIPVPEAE